MVIYVSQNAGVAKLVDAFALGANAFGYGGSSPLPGTFYKDATFASLCVSGLVFSC